MLTTRWIDYETKTLSKAIELLLAIPNDEDSQESTAYANWKTEKMFDSDQTIKLNSRNITFNYIKYSYNQILPGGQPLEDRTVPKDGFVIPYFNDVNVNYIINRNSDALKVLRKLLKYSGRNEITKNAFSINSNFFIWLISKVYSGKNVIETDSEELHDIKVDTIKGFKGNTEDLLTKVSADGESVMNIISTLSFLLESKNLSQIKLNLEYRNHPNIELVLNDIGTISTPLEQYLGEFENRNSNPDLLLSKLYLLIYIEIIPILIQSYQNDVENDLWGKNKNIEFLADVAKELSEKVKKRVEALKNDSN